MIPSPSLKEALETKTMAFRHKRAAEARAHAEHQAKIRKILDSYPDDRGSRASHDVQQLRVMAALLEFGEVESKEANLRLGVMDEERPGTLTGYECGLQRIANSLTESGIAVRIEERHAKNGVKTVLVLDE